ncbi:hypothetical protein NE236_24720 [Actinoallomurus purpureus]|uniref:PHP domain-containing protein n=1 Tax=Actinoallomurus purpureus TaxID=478114 RepID=UPI002093FAAD|nr:hypothetical protein [Actinoallomurus purpureus]MCO6008187.1 hypothetical protein [Actinoallomurus purpureus]
MTLLMRIDLHSHSNASDGTDSPAEVVRQAHEESPEVCERLIAEATGAEPISVAGG